MTGLGATVDDGYHYRRYDPEIDRTVALRPASVERDLERLHAWFHSEHVLPYWRLDEPLPVLRRKLAAKVGDDHLTPYVGCLDGVPMSYWERYWAADDSLADHYEAAPADQGVHLLVGPPEYLGRGYATALLRATTALAFGHSATRRVVAEPDVRNAPVHRVFEKCGYEVVSELDLDGKDALLFVCERDRFEREVLAPAASFDGEVGR